MRVFVLKAGICSLLAFLVSWQISFAIDARDLKRQKGEVIYDDGKFGLIRVPVEGNKSKGKVVRKAPPGNHGHNSIRPGRPGIPPFVKPGTAPLGKQGVLPNYVDDDYNWWWNNNTISVYANYTSNTGSPLLRGNTYWPTLPGDKVYVYTSFHADEETTVLIDWNINGYDVNGNNVYHYASWDFGGQRLYPDYWYYAWYHPDTALPSGFYHTSTYVYDQENGSPYCDQEYYYCNDYNEDGDTDDEGECWGWDGNGDGDYDDLICYESISCYSEYQGWDGNGDGDYEDTICYGYYDYESCKFRVND